MSQKHGPAVKIAEKRPDPCKAGAPQEHILKDMPRNGSNARDRCAQSGPRLTPQAFADLFEASSRTLWCITAAVLGTRDEADDVLQEAALIALTKLDEFDPATSFTAWMGQIARYVALNSRRRRVRRSGIPSPDGVLESSPAPVPMEQAGVDARGQLSDTEGTFDDHVLSALSTLDETARACLLLRTVHDMPYRDIAMALDIPEGTAMSHVHRARKALREVLAPHSGRQDKTGGAA